MFNKRICLKTGLARIALDKIIRFPRMVKATALRSKHSKCSIAMEKPSIGTGALNSTMKSHVAHIKIDSSSKLEA